MSFVAAGTGAVVNHCGACEWLAWPRIRARGLRPFSSAVARLVTTSAAAPSEIDEAFAAVTVPSLAKAGFRCGIFSGRALPGCSSASIRVSPLRVVTVTGVISPLNALSA